MTPQQKIKLTILYQAKAEGDYDDEIPDDPELLDDAYEELDWDIRHDYESEFRSGSIETGLECEYSRHYESKSVAAEMHDGSFVGWTYWYGGGKHGEPGAIEWMDDAYNLECVSEEKLVTVCTFTKVDE